jgi:hypothetical protein
MAVGLELVTRSNNSNIVIELLSNNFIHDFVNQLKRNHELYSINSFKETIRPKSVVPWNQKTIDQLTEVFKTTIRDLNALGVSFPVTENEIIIANDVYTRDLLNRLHRHFTTSHNSGNTWQYGTDLNFVVPESKSAEWKKLIHDINHAVHETEVYIMTEHIQTFKSLYFEYQIIFDRSSPKLNDMVSVVTGYDPNGGYFQELKQEHKQYFSDTLEYDVWLTLDQVQGKNYHRCYFEMDDPREWDIDTHVVYSGSLSLTDRAVAKDPQITKWLKSYGIDPGPDHCGMPIGNIVEGKEIVPALRDQSIIDIIIHES